MFFPTLAFCCLVYQPHHTPLLLPPRRRRLAEELSSLDAQLREAREHREAQHRLNAELAAELKRLAAESALGPIMTLDVNGNVRRPATRFVQRCWR